MTHTISLIVIQMLTLTELLSRWHVTLRVVNERSWASVFGSPGASSPLPKHPLRTSGMQTDPNNEEDEIAVLEWIRLADFYQWPHITQFRSWEELLWLVENSDFQAQSKGMREYNDRESQRISDSWESILQLVADGANASPRGGRGDRSVSGTSSSSSSDSRAPSDSGPAAADAAPSELLPASAEEALQKNYGVQLSPSCVGYTS